MSGPRPGCLLLVALMHPFALDCADMNLRIDQLTCILTHPWLYITPEALSQNSRKLQVDKFAHSVRVRVICGETRVRFEIRQTAEMGLLGICREMRVRVLNSGDIK